MLLPYAHLLAFHDLLRTFAGSVSGELGELALVLGRLRRRRRSLRGGARRTSAASARARRRSRAASASRACCARAAGRATHARARSRRCRGGGRRGARSASAGAIASRLDPETPRAETLGARRSGAGERSGTRQEAVRTRRRAESMLVAIGGHPMAATIDSPTSPPPAPGRFQARRAFRLLREVIRTPTTPTRCSSSSRRWAATTARRHSSASSPSPRGGGCSRRARGSSRCSPTRRTSPRCRRRASAAGTCASCAGAASSPSGLLEARERGARDAGARRRRARVVLRPHQRDARPLARAHRLRHRRARRGGADRVQPRTDPEPELPDPARRRGREGAEELGPRLAALPVERLPPRPTREAAHRGAVRGAAAAHGARRCARGSASSPRRSGTRTGSEPAAVQRAMV